MFFKKAHTPTPLQSSLVVLLLVLCTVTGVNAMVTYGSDRAPSDTMLRNSQTMEVFSW